MDCQGDEIARKCKKSAMEDDGGLVGEGVVCNVVANEETETNIDGYQEMELITTQILEKLDGCSEMVYESLVLRCMVLLDEYEDRLNMLHKEQMDELRDVIKGLRPLDSSNEDDNTLLHIARYFLQDPHTSSSEVYELMKSLHKELFNVIEDQLIMLHKEQMDIWRDVIKKLQAVLHSSYEDDNTLLLQNPHSSSSEAFLGDE